MEYNVVSGLEPALTGVSHQFNRPMSNANDAYWTNSKVFVQFIDIRPIYMDFGGFRNCMEAHFKVSSLDDDALWQFFLTNKSSLESLIQRTVNNAGINTLKVLHVEFERGSIDISVVLGLVLNAIQAYPQIKELSQDLAKLIPHLTEAIGVFFQSFSSGSLVRSGYPNPGTTAAVIGASVGVALALGVSAPVVIAASALTAAVAWFRRKKE
jgi:hypothetical protein